MDSDPPACDSPFTSWQPEGQTLSVEEILRRVAEFPARHAVVTGGEPLIAAGIEVWLDKDALRGGDAWDQKIRRQIRDCALFVAVISRNT